MLQRKDLVDISDKDYANRKNEFMQCQNCGHTWGGTRGDYFSMKMDSVFVCGECDSGDIELVKELITIVKTIKAKQIETVDIIASGYA